MHKLLFSMKKSLLLSLLALAFNTAWAGPVSRDAALRQAEQFLNKQHATAGGARLRLAPQPKALREASTEQQHYYVFNVGEDDGFVMVSGDDRTPAIIGYSTQGSFDYDQLPDNVRYWFDEYDRQIAHLDKVPAARVSSIERARIAPMLTTLWGQNSPFNDQSPIDTHTNQRSLVGCIATAAAQVMKYHKYPAKTAATIPAYRTETLRMTVPAIQPFEIEWDKMIDYYTVFSTSEQKEAVAKLTNAVACASKMDFTSEGSGAQSSDLVYALYKYFDYDENMDWADRTEYTFDEWNDLIYAELAAKRPVLYMGYSIGGGHAFVIDGYDKNDMFHVNWGWNGMLQGSYFLLSLLNPGDNSGAGASTTDDGYSIFQEAILGLQPSTGERIPSCMLITSRIYANRMSSGGTANVVRQSDGTFTASIYLNVYNRHVKEYEVENALGLFNEQGELVDVFVGEKVTLLYNYQKSRTFNVQFGKNQPDGNYTIKGINRVVGDTDWQLNKNADTQKIDVVLSGGTAALTSPYPDYQVSFEVVTEKPVRNKDFDIRVTLHNRGTQQHDALIFVVDDEPVCGEHFEVGHNETITKNFSFVLKRYGTYKLAVVTSDAYFRFTELGDTTIVVDDPEYFTAGNIYYRITSFDNQTVEVSSTNVPADHYVGEVVIPATVENKGTTYKVALIGNSAFQGQSKMTSVHIGENVEKVSTLAFKNCTALTDVSFGNSMTIYKDAFVGCDNITNVYVKDVADWCHTTFVNQLSNPLYTPNNYTRHLFVNGEEVSGKVVFPSDVTATGFLAFYDCAGITEVELPEGLTLIDRFTFAGCRGLRKINVPQTVTELGHSSFIRCESLSYIDLPASLKTINKLCFSKSGLKSLRVRAVTPPACKADDVFDADVYQNSTLYVPTGCKAVYEAASTWKNFQHIEELADDEQPAGISQTTVTMPVETRYFDLSGQQRQNGQKKGVVLMQQRQSDGTVVVKKVVY